jgi:hypothetical protein
LFLTSKSIMKRSIKSWPAFSIAILRKLRVDQPFASTLFADGSTCNRCVGVQGLLQFGHHFMWTVLIYHELFERLPLPSRNRAGLRPFTLRTWMILSYVLITHLGVSYVVRFVCTFDITSRIASLT